MKPRSKILDTADFPIVEHVQENGYRVLELPQELRRLFDEEGFHAIRINSKELAASIPNYAGKTPTDYSLLPHQDHHPLDRKRFLTLSQTSEVKRGSSTLLLFPDTFKKMFPTILDYFQTHREEIQKVSRYDTSFIISENQFDRCLETGDLAAVLTEVLEGKSDEESLQFGYGGLLGYLIQGEHSDFLMQELYRRYENEILSEQWEHPGVFIFDNSKVFHARLGGNKNLLQRNWCV